MKSFRIAAILAPGVTSAQWWAGAPDCAVSFPTLPTISLSLSLSLPYRSKLIMPSAILPIFSFRRRFRNRHHINLLASANRLLCIRQGLKHRVVPVLKLLGHTYSLDVLRFSLLIAVLSVVVLYLGRQHSSADYHLPSRLCDLGCTRRLAH